MSRAVLLVVRDVETARQLNDWLGQLEFGVTMVANEAMAIDQFSKQAFGLVVFELEGTKLGALGMLARMRELTPGHPVPALGVTGARGAELERLKSFAGHLGVKHFLHAPVDRLRLEKRLVELLGPDALPGDRTAPATAELPSVSDAEEEVATLRFERNTLKRQLAHERLGLSGDASRDDARKAYFELVTAYHAEKTKCRTEEGEMLVDQIQELLRSAYLALRRGSAGRTAESLRTPEKPAAPAPKAAPVARPAPVAPRPVEPAPPPRSKPSPAPLPPEPSIADVRRREVSAGDENPDDLLRLARVASILGDDKMARRLLERVLMLKPNNQEARALMTRRLSARRKGTLSKILEEKLR